MISCGVDLVEIGRIEAAIARNGQRFLDRIYTPQEQASCNGNSQRLAARFAIKEAVAKALGTGIGDLSWTEIEVRNNERGAPHLILHGNAQRIANKQGVSSWSISLSHEKEYAIGFVIVEIDTQKVMRDA